MTFDVGAAATSWGRDPTAGGQHFNYAAVAELTTEHTTSSADQVKTIIHLPYFKDLFNFRISIILSISNTMLIFGRKRLSALI